MTVPAVSAGDVAGRVDFPAARAAMAAAGVPRGTELLELDDARGRIIAAPLYAADDLVPFARSAMDGFAVRALDTLGAGPGGLVLPVRGALYAGDPPGALTRGAAAAIATGGPLPDGADAVVPFELVEQRTATIVLRAPLAAGDHVFFPGDDARRGELLAGPGDVVSPGRAALLAAAGHAALTVYRRPRVAVVSTGNELVPVGAQPAAGQIRNSNATMLAAFAAADGAEIVRSVHVRDEFAMLHDALRDALGVADIVITSGGASAGERDFVKPALHALGAHFAFESVALRPAKPTAFARRGSALVAVLPGNPAAAFVGYCTLVRGTVRGMAGRTPGFAPAVTARLQGTIHGKADRHFVMFGAVAHDATAGFTVRPLENQCSSLVRTPAAASGLIVVPPGCGSLADGAAVTVEVIDWDGVAFAARAAC